MNDEQITSGSLYQVNIADKCEVYGFIFLKKNVSGNGFIANGVGDFAGRIKDELNGKIVTCVGKFPVTYGGVTGSRDIFLYDNKLVTSLNKPPEHFCSIIE